MLLMDTSGNGQPGSGDDPLAPSRAGTALTMNSNLLNCNTSDSDHTGQLVDLQGGIYQGVERNSDFGRHQALRANSVINGNQATGFNFEERTSPTGPLVGQGSGDLEDGDSDGAFETFDANGSTNAGKSVNISTNLVFGDRNGDGNPDHVSIPWALASQLGVDTSDGCSAGGSGGTDPQVFIPMADTNQDGRPDSVVPDLDGNGSPDPDLLRSPPLVAAAVPTMNTWWLATLGIGLMLMALRRLRVRDAYRPN
jgi:hypothetical protein